MSSAKDDAAGKRNLSRPNFGRPLRGRPPGWSPWQLARRITLGNLAQRRCRLKGSDRLGRSSMRMAATLVLFPAKRVWTNPLRQRCRKKFDCLDRNRGLSYRKAAGFLAGEAGSSDKRPRMSRG